ncbi:SpoIIAA Anti-anti-sigma regulatory factor (antagonist of anti-sigma factor) [Methylophilaceae bacterium]|jgi:anti-anti-sigma factor
MITGSNYKLSGRVDGTNAEHYETEISDLLKEADQSFSIDLSDLDYISSIGLRIFLKVAKALKSDDKKLVLVKPNAVILDLLLMSGFDKIIEIQH